MKDSIRGHRPGVRPGHGVSASQTAPHLLSILNSESEELVPASQLTPLLLVGSGSKIRHEILLRDMSRRAAIILLQPGPITWQREHVAHAVQIDANDVASVVETARALMAEHGADAIATYEENLLTLVGEITHHTGLKGLSREAARTVRDKHAQREALRARGHTRPVRSEAVTDPAAGEALAHELGFPLIIKLRNLSGSLGVRVVNDLSEFREMFQASVELGDRAPDQTGGVLVEEFLEGPEYCVDCWVLNGRATPLFPARILTEYTFQVIDTGYIIARDVAEPRIVAAMEAAACDAAVAMGVDRTIVSVDVKWTKGEPRILEINGRPGGVLPHVAVLTNGMSVGELFADVALGRVPTPPAGPGKAAGVAFIYPTESGTFGGVRMGAQCEGQDWLIRVQETAQHGARMDPPEINPWGSVAWALVTGDTAAIVEERMDLLRATAEVLSLALVD